MKWTLKERLCNYTGQVSIRQWPLKSHLSTESSINIESETEVRPRMCVLTGPSLSSKAQTDCSMVWTREERHCLWQTPVWSLENSISHKIKLLHQPHHDQNEMALKILSFCSPFMCKKPNIFITHLAFELPCPCKGGALKGQHNHAKLGQVANILSDRNKCRKHWKAGVRVTEVSLSYLVAVSKRDQVQKSTVEKQVE